MKRVGLIGLGDMGIGMAANIVKNGFELTGYDLREERLQMLAELGGKPASNPKEVGKNSDAVFVMVMNGDQFKQVIFGEAGLLSGLKTGSTIIVTATIHPREMVEIGESLASSGINLIDSPVSGGKSGADNGALTLMSAADKAVLEDCREVFEAVGTKIFHVGEKIGMGQTIKAALQAFMGASFTAIFESLVLGAKCGIKAETLYEVFGASGVSSPVFLNCGKLIMERKFEGTGSHIGTMYKDMGITMTMAKENGVAMFTAAAAYELFQTGISLYPEGDNWTIVRFLEKIAGTEVKQENLEE